MPTNLSDLTPAQLAERRDLILGSFSRIDKEFDRRRGENRLLVKADDIEWESASRVHPTAQEGHHLARIISPELRFNIHTFRVFKRSSAGKETDGAFHTHGDAVKFYLQGKGKEIIDKEEVHVEPGDMAFIPGNVWHGTENTGDEPMVFIAFHQIPGTQLPVPASWQYPVADMEGHDDLDELLESTGKEDPPSMGSAALYSRRQHFLHQALAGSEERSPVGATGGPPNGAAYRPRVGVQYPYHSALDTPSPARSQRYDFPHSWGSSSLLHRRVGQSDSG